MGLFSKAKHAVKKVAKPVVDLHKKAGNAAIGLGKKGVQVAVPLAATSLSYSTLGATQHTTDRIIGKNKSLGGGTRLQTLASKTTRDYNSVARPVEAGLALGFLGGYVGGAFGPSAAKLAEGPIGGGTTAPGYAGGAFGRDSVNDTYGAPTSEATVAILAVLALGAFLLLK